MSGSEIEPSQQMESDDQSLLSAGKGSIQYGACDDPGRGPGKARSEFIQTVRSMTIEPIVFSFMVGSIMNVSILTSFMMEVACQRHLQYSPDVCRNLSHHESEKESVEQLAADFSLYSNLLNLVGAFSMIFIAPWSDRYGRRPPLVGAIAGSLVTDLGLVLCTTYEPRLEYVLLARIPTELFGGFICVLTITFSHASEVTTDRNRTLKYTSVEIAMGLGMTFGRLAGGLVRESYGYFYVYVVVGILHAFCLAWTLLVLQETTGLDKVVPWSEKARNFFACQSFRSGIEATFRRREGRKRALIVLLLLSMCFIVLTYESFGSIGFLYVHHIYNWDITTYSIVQTIFSLVQMVITLLLVPLLVKVFKMNDFKLGMIGAASMIAKNLTTAFSRGHLFVYYLSQSVGVVGQFSMLAIRSGLSKLLEKNELGKVFSFLATCESVLPMFGTILVTEVFKSTLDTYPNCTYLLTVLFLLLPMATFVWAYNYSKKSTPQVFTEDLLPEKESDREKMYNGEFPAHN